MVIDVIVHSGDVEAFLQERPELIVTALRAEMNKQTINLLSYIVDEKLQGQVLNHRTGNLANSGFTETAASGPVLEGTVGFGRTVPYAAILNYGGTINIPEVSGKLMVFQRAAATVFTRRHKAFTVTMPAHNYMESSLEERKGAIEAGFMAAVGKAV